METKDVYNQRRSVNFFDKSKMLEDSLLEKIINLAVLAPSAYNLQPWRIIAVQSEENKNKLFQLSFKQPKILEAPVTLIIIGNKEGVSDENPVWAETQQSFGLNPEQLEGRKNAAKKFYSSSEEKKTKFAESNAGILAMSIMIAAKEFGVDTHPMSGIDFEGIHKEFNLKQGETVVMLMSMGYHDTSKQLYPRRPRRNFDEIVTIV